MSKIWMGGSLYFSMTGAFTPTTTAPILFAGRLRKAVFDTFPINLRTLRANKLHFLLPVVLRSWAFPAKSSLLLSPAQIVHFKLLL